MVTVFLRWFESNWLHQFYKGESQMSCVFLNDQAEPASHSKFLEVLQLWRVLPGTVNPVPLGKHSRFESVDLHQDVLPNQQIV